MTSLLTDKRAAAHSAERAAIAAPAEQAQRGPRGYLSGMLLTPFIHMNSVFI